MESKRSYCVEVLGQQVYGGSVGPLSGSPPALRTSHTLFVGTLSSGVASPPFAQQYLRVWVTAELSCQLLGTAGRGGTVLLNNTSNNNNNNNSNTTTTTTTTTTTATTTTRRRRLRLLLLVNENKVLFCVLFLQTQWRTWPITKQRIKTQS